MRAKAATARATAAQAVAAPDAGRSDAARSDGAHPDGAERPVPVMTTPCRPIGSVSLCAGPLPCRPAALPARRPSCRTPVRPR
ncbi:hypothetical protein SCWH03_12720 [Streptomyces pacificus]|uniref:Uncharacterized protein n=1 Tax=Streptomyces pacificus TaxID=2705029 RepID=A0A6A0AQW1_9ACTN|nr:hypothetical protein SCWH03_12720 [Streptomyces pacificus]